MPSVDAITAAMRQENEMEEAKHSPTPWRVKDDLVLGCDGTEVADCIGNTIAEDRANAAFIVAAANQHADLLRVAETAEKYRRREATARELDQAIDAWKESK